MDVEPVYGGASYLEKQDFIIMNQKKRIEEKQAVLDGLVMKIEDVNAVIEEAVDLAYEKACEVVTKRVKEDTVKHAVDVVKDYGELLQQQPKDKLSDKSKSVASKVVNAIVAKLEKASQALLGNIISALNEPKNKVKAKEQIKEQIKEQARVSIQAKLKEKQKQVMEYEKKQDVHIRKKNMELQEAFVIPVSYTHLDVYKRQFIKAGVGPLARKYYKEPIACNFVSYGSNVVASVKDEFKEIVETYLSKFEFYHCFETPNMHWLDERMKEKGYRVCFMAEYFLPDMERLKRLECNYCLLYTSRCV